MPRSVCLLVAAVAALNASGCCFVCTCPDQSTTLIRENPFTAAGRCNDICALFGEDAGDVAFTPDECNEVAAKTSPTPDALNGD